MLKPMSNRLLIENDFVLMPGRGIIDILYKYR